MFYLANLCGLLLRLTRRHARPNRIGNERSRVLFQCTDHDARITISHCSFRVQPVRSGEFVALTDVREEALKKNVGVSEGCAVKDFRVTFWKDGHPTDFAILDADAQHAALRMGGLPCRVETGDGYVT